MTRTHVSLKTVLVTGVAVLALWAYFQFWRAASALNQLNQGEFHAQTKDFY